MSQWTNSPEVYENAGHEAGRSMRHGDAATAKHWREWMGRAIKLERPENRAAAQALYDAAYKKVATPRGPMSNPSKPTGPKFALAHFGLHVIKNPAGTYSYVGSIPRELGTEVEASRAAIIGGLAYKNASGEIVETKFPAFKTREEAVTFAESKGHSVVKSNPSKKPTKEELLAHHRRAVSLLRPKPAPDRFARYMEAMATIDKHRPKKNPAPRNAINLAHFAKWNRGGKHKWFTKAIAAKMPMIGGTMGQHDPARTPVVVKLFNPGGAGSWFITEANFETGEAFGYVTGLGGDELGFMDLNEMRAFKGRFGLPLERDEHFSGTLAEVMEGKANPSKRSKARVKTLRGRAQVVNAAGRVLAGYTKKRDGKGYKKVARSLAASLNANPSKRANGKGFVIVADVHGKPLYFSDAKGRKPPEFLEYSPDATVFQSFVQAQKIGLMLVKTFRVLGKYKIQVRPRPKS